MRGLTAVELLDVWERGLALDRVERALAILAAADPEASYESLAELPIGARDSRLIRLRASTFGPDLNALAECSGCGERLELAFSADEILAGPEGEPGQPVSMEAGEFEVAFRLPSSLDLLAVLEEQEPEGARRLLLRRCLLRASRQGEPCSIEALADDFIARLSRRMADLDPQAEVRLAYVCPGCENEEQQTFDVVSFFWSEIDAWARRIMLEVHMLAAAYGWSEGEILGMSPVRRQYYLSLIAV